MRKNKNFIGLCYLFYNLVLFYFALHKVGDGTPSLFLKFRTFKGLNLATLLLRKVGCLLYTGKVRG